MDIYELPEEVLTYPPPAVPMLPLFSTSNLAWRCSGDRHSRFLAPDVAFLPSGRVAMFHALRLLGVNGDSEVMVPAYHCGSMIEPIIYLGATPRFIHLKEDLQLTPEQLSPYLHANTKALIIPHYFGFTQNILPIRQFCDDQGIGLIEDCAHCFFRCDEFSPIGSAGDFSITSTVKFFPGTEGGILAANRRTKIDRNIFQYAPTLAAQAKTILNTLETAAAFNRLGFLGSVLRIRSRQPNTNFKTRSPLEKWNETRPFNQSTFHWFDPDQIGSSTHWLNRFITKKSNYSDIIKLRRKNFIRYLNRLIGVPGVSPLYSELPNKIVPYVFPLLLKQPERDFRRLKHKSIPIWRWEELVVSNCKVSNDYRLRLIQLPCHQSLRTDEIDWIINTIIDTVSKK